MNRRKILFIVLLIAVIAVAAVIAAKRVRSELIAEPKLIVDQKFEKIDMNSLEVFAETTTDWANKYAPDAAGRYKNPRTGEYTIVNAMRCASCGQLIPVPQAPPDQMKTASEKGAGKELIQNLMLNYMCPKCGKHAWFPPPPPRPRSAPAPQSAPKSAPTGG